MKRKILAILLIALLSTNLLWLGFLILGPERVVNALERRIHVYFGLELGGSVNVPIDLIVGPQITNDPLSKYQWALRMLLDGSEYWEIQGDAPRDVVVAVIDHRGPDMQHLDLVNQFYQGGGYNFRDGTSILRAEDDGAPATSSNTHGTCAASIIASEAGNDVGMAGVFHRAKIMPLQSDGHVPKAINYAIENGAEVILLAGGAGNISAALWPMFNRESNRLPEPDLYQGENIDEMRAIINSLEKAYKNGIPVISGVGNSQAFGMSLYADHHSTISVGSHDIFGRVSDHNSFSYTVDVFAPGGSRISIGNLSEITRLFEQADSFRVSSPRADFDDPLCAVGYDEYSFLTLVSAAMPHVAGAVAMIKSYLPKADVEDVRSLLRKSTLPLEPSGSLLEARGGRLSLRLLREQIDIRLN